MIPKISKIILAVLLLFCLFDLPYGYYQFVRVASMVAFAYLAYNSFRRKNIVFGIVFVVLTVLFQPIEKISLGRTLWNVVDVIVAIFLIVSLLIEKDTEPKEG